MATSDSAEELKRIFNLCDENKQGFISVNNFLKEFKRSFEEENVHMSDQEEKQFIECFDSDGDGLISFADFCKGVENVREISSSCNSSRLGNNSSRNHTRSTDSNDSNEKFYSLSPSSSSSSSATYSSSRSQTPSPVKARKLADQVSQARDYS